MTEGVVQTEQGPVRGSRDGRVWAWRGVPYAQPPVGPLRFCLPERPRPWHGEREARHFGPAAAQRMTRLGGGRQQLGPFLSEDCLFLNIWSPAADERRRPVMVWLHGGAFVGGSGALYRGEPMAAGGDIVVVTINYRLGVFGFVNFADALGDEGFGRNLGLHDVIAALSWIRRNIAGFGRDPHRVTLTGGSAGSIMVSLLMLTATAGTLFHQAILQSGVFTLAQTRETSLRVATAYLDHLRARPGGLGDLRDCSTATLLDAEMAVARRLADTSPAAPWFDGALLPASFAAARDRPPAAIPVLAGANRDEIVLFRVMQGARILRMTRLALLDLIRRDCPPETADHLAQTYPDTTAGNCALASDANFIMPTLHVAERHAVRGLPVWLYRFDYAHPLLRACHALELVFLWPFPGLLGAVLRGGFLTGRRSGLSERMRAAWTSFVRTGTPGEDWPSFRLPERATRLFALQDRVVADPMRDRREAWGGRDLEAGR